MLCVFFVGPEIVSAAPWNDLIWNDSDFSFDMNCKSHRIHGTGIFTYLQFPFKSTKCR